MKKTVVLLLIICCYAKWHEASCTPVINKVTFLKENIFEEDDPYYACPDRQIKISLNNLTDADQSFTLQCHNNGGSWVDIVTYNRSTTGLHLFGFSMPYSYFTNISGLNPHEGMYFRVKNGSTYTTYTYPAGKNALFYFPKFQFPSGKNVIVEPPACSGGKTTIKLPYQDDINYNITVKGAGGVWANGKSYATSNSSDVSKTTINGYSYYLITDTFPAGNNTLVIEYKVTGAGVPVSPCPTETTFSVPTIPQFTLTNRTYVDNTTDNAGNSVQIKTRGGAGRVSFSVSGSKYQSITISANGVNTYPQTVNLTLQSNGYYSGTATIDLPAGTYSVYAANISCSTTTQSVTLSEPAAVSFSTASTAVSCNVSNWLAGNTGDGKITLSSIAGGIGNRSYSIDGANPVAITGTSTTITGLSAGSHTVKIADNYGNELTRSVTVNAPNAISVGATSSAPTLSCKQDGKITLTVSGGTSPYNYGKTNTGTSFASTNSLTDYAGGATTVYVKDKNGCVVSKSVTVPPAPAAMSATLAPTAPTCNGGNDGKCVLTMSNIQGILSVSGIPSGATSAMSSNVITISNLPAGTHSCTVTDTKSGLSCSISVPFSVPVKPLVSISSMEITPVSDKESATGKISFNVSGGNGGTYTAYLYEGTSSTALKSATGTSSFTFSDLNGEFTNGGKLYRIRVADAKSCQSALTDVKVPEPEKALALQAGISTPVSCNGRSDAVVTLTAKDGWGTYEYSKNGSTWVASNLFSGFGAGNHTFYVRDKNGGKTSVAITVEHPAPLTIVRDSLFHVLCHGDATGLLRYKIAGGTYPYLLQSVTATASIIGLDTMLTVTNLPANSYTFTVQDSRGCLTAAAPEIITQPSKLKLAVLSKTHTSCELDNGVLSGQSSGGVAPYTYALAALGTSYTSPQTLEVSDTAYFHNLPAATYRMLATDEHGCADSSSLQTINNYTNPAANDFFIRDVACFGENNGRVEVEPLVGTSSISTYTIYNSDSTFVQSRATCTFDSLYVGAYRIDIYDEVGCKSNVFYPITVHEPDSLHIVVNAVLPVVSKTTRGGKINFTIRGGNEGSKSVVLRRNDGVSVDSLVGISNVPLSFTTYAGRYTLQVTDVKNCSFTTDFLQVVEPADSLRLIVTKVQAARCKSQVGSITVEGIGGWGGYRYKHASEVGFSSLNTFENLYSGTYIITVTDSLGATYSEAITVHEPKDSLQATVTDLIVPTCGNNGALAISVSGGTQPYNLYEGIDTVFCAQPQVVQWLGKGSGNHLLHLADSNGCRFDIEVNLPATSQLAIDEFAVQYPDLPAATNGSLAAIVRGGVSPYTYQWTQNFSVPLPLNDSLLVNIPSGHYSVEVTDAEGCTVQKEIYLSDPSDISFTVVDVGHETSFGAANGYAVLHINETLFAYEIVTPQNIVTTYNSSDSTSIFFTRNDTIFLKNLDGGRWFVLGKNAAGSTVVATFEIYSYTEFSISRITVTHATRPGSSDGQVRIDVQGGGGGNSFTWETANHLALQEKAENGTYSILSNIPAGMYRVQVEDIYGNILQKEVEVKEPEQALTLSIAEYRNQSCKTYQNAYVILSASGGWGDYQFRHQSESHFSNGFSYRNLEVADHYFYLIDQQGVTDSVLVHITEPEYLRTLLISVDSAKCKNAYDGSIFFDIKGGTTPYFLSELDSRIWVEDSVARGLHEGFHTFVFTDSNSCVGQDTLTVYVPEPDSLLFNNIKVTHTTCNEDNGAMEVRMQGGTAPYFYNWTDFRTASSVSSHSLVTNLQQNGNYNLDVTDRNGCTQHLEQFIRPSTRPTVTDLKTTAVLCYGDTTGTAQVLDVLPAIPYAPYSFTWSNGDTGDFSNRFHKSLHHVTIADTNGCATDRYFDIGQPDSLRILITDIRIPHCYGYSDGHIITESLGGVTPYAYTWSTGDTTPNIENLTKGDYHVRLIDANSCLYEKSINVDEPEYQTVDLGDDATICPGNTHLLDGQDYTSYRWYTNDGNIFNERYLRVNQENKYFLEAIDERGCSAWGNVNVSVGNSALQADFLLASEGHLGDTLMAFELSNLRLDSMRWDYNREAFEQIGSGDVHAYTLQLLNRQIGFYNIDLYAYSGGCYSRITKQVDVLAQLEDEEQWVTYQEPLITSVTLYPNPNNGSFTLEVVLREATDIRLVLFEVASGACRNDRTERGLDKYTLSYNLPQLNSGVYALIVTAEKERKQVKLMIGK